MFQYKKQRNSQYKIFLLYFQLEMSFFLGLHSLLALDIAFGILIKCFHEMPEILWEFGKLQVLIFVFTGYPDRGQCGQTPKVIFNLYIKLTRAFL